MVMSQELQQSLVFLQDMILEQMGQQIHLLLKIVIFLVE